MGYCTRHESGENKEIHIFNGPWSLNPKSATLDLPKVSLDPESASPELGCSPRSPATVADA